MIGVKILVNEYLFLSNNKENEIRNFANDDVIVNFTNIENTNIWIAKYSLKGNGLSEAKKLSDIHTKLMEFPQRPQILSCGSSEYFNKALYPKINRLERSLRKLLYIASSMPDIEIEKSIQSINNLEEKDFGTIFDLLFVDKDFIKTLKSRINADNKSKFNGMDKFTKDEISKFINEIPENTIWNKLFSNETVPTLRRKFRKVKEYRNDIMHAHNIDKITYGKAKYLFDRVNQELDNAIKGFINDIEENNISEEIILKYADTISKAIIDFDLYFQNLEETTQNILQTFNSTILNQLNQLNYFLENSNLNEYQKILESNDSLKKSIDMIPKYIQNSIKPFSTLSNVESSNNKENT